MAERLVVSGLERGNDRDDDPREEADSTTDDAPQGPRDVEIDDLFPLLVHLRDGVLFDQPENQRAKDMAERKNKDGERQQFQIEPPVSGVWRKVDIQRGWRLWCVHGSC